MKNELSVISEKIAELKKQLDELNTQVKVKVENQIPSLKRGDVIYNEWGTEGRFGLSIIDRISGFKNKHFVFLNIKDELLFNHINRAFTDNEIVRLATEAEKQILISAMRAAGKDFDFEKMEVIDYRWRANILELYYYVDSDGVIKEKEECFLIMDDRRFNIGNYFKTEEEAQKFKENCIKYLNTKK